MARKLYSTIVPLIAIVLGAIAAGIVALPKVEISQASNSRPHAGVYERPHTPGLDIVEYNAR